VLREFGFRDELEALYLALVDTPALTMTELASLGVIAEDALPIALKSLESDGLINQLPGRPRRYSAVDPELGLIGLISAREQALCNARSAAHQLTERFRAARRGRDPLDLIEVVVGRDPQLRRFDQMLRLATTELRGFDKPPYISAPMTVDETLLERLAEGVRVRCIYDQSGLEVPGRSPEIQLYRGAGEQQRVLDGVPLKMVIADDKLALILLAGGSTTTISSLYVHPSALLDDLCLLFDTLWRFSVPLHAKDDEPGAADRPTEDEAEILGLFAAGMTDEAIARHLSISTRTVQRHLRAIMDRLGAHTRFQAGLRASRRNWL
jgi:DNA-binding CsgD family transcriptional regulator/sugar-specific transcriptional regulator TrmB